jgi:CelD/BcsL family acetyltransferase involved in cellulose biosynthesis
MLVHEIKTLDAVAELYPQWEKLNLKLSRSTPFQHPGWLMPLWRHLGQGDLRVLAAYSSGELCAILPLASQDNVLRFIGSGITDYQDGLVTPTAVSGMCEFLERYFSTQGCDLDCIPPHSILRSLSGLWEQSHTTPVTTLPSTVDEYDKSLSTRFRHTLNNSWNRLKRLGDVRFAAADQSNAHRFFESLLELHHARWLRRNMPGVLATPEIQDFHREAISKLLPAGQIRLAALLVNDVPISVLYLLWRNPAAYYYIGGFSPDFSGYSPGSLLIRHAIHESIQAGLAEFHFLRGSEDYKYRWGAHDRALHRLRVDGNRRGNT